MSRPLRIQYPGALYHITSRGNKKEKIFSNNSDRQLFLNILKIIIEKHNWLCHAYCLMNNHYHLLIETSNGNLSNGMRDLNGIYTQKYNKKNNSVGHILQGRFKSLLIEKETYLLEVARYIVLNPVRACLVKNPEDWKWSSYKATSGFEAVPIFLTTDYILNFFSKIKNQAQKKYKFFIQEGISKPSPFNELKEGFILGFPHFTHEIWKIADNVIKIKDFKKSDRIIGRPAIKEIFEDIETKNNRNEAIIFASIRCGYSTSEIAKFLNLSASTVSRIINKSYPKMQS